jgi:hypothetical protein
MAHREGEPMGRIREVRVTTTDRKNATVRVEYDGGFTHVILADVSMPSPQTQRPRKFKLPTGQMR